MSGSGKPLLGLWLYRNGEDWNFKEDCPISETTRKVSINYKLFSFKLLHEYFINIFISSKL